MDDSALLKRIQVAIALVRERREDIPQLVEAHIAQANLHLGQRVQGIAPEALALLQQHPAPGMRGS